MKTLSLEEFKNLMGAKEVKFISKKESAKMQKTDQDWMNEIQEMLEGKKKPTNEFVLYLLDKIREVQAEGQMLEREIQGRSQQLEQMRVRAIQLQAVMNAHVEDIKNWLEKGESKTKQLLNQLDKSYYDKEAADLLDKEEKRESVAKPIVGRP